MNEEDYQEQLEMDLESQREDYEGQIQVLKETIRVQQSEIDYLRGLVKRLAKELGVNLP